MSINIYHHQSGFSGVVEIVAVALVFSLLSFSIWRVAIQPASDPSAIAEDKSLSSTETTNQPNGAQTLEDLQTPDKPSEQTPAQPDDDYNYPKNQTIVFSKGGGAVEGNQIVVSVTTAEPQSGTCQHLFTLGNSQVYEETTIKDSKTCNLTISAKRFSKIGTWNYQLNFISGDRLISGSSAVVPIDVVPNVFYFTKGGGYYDSGVISVSQTAAAYHTGECRYIFTLGNIKVEKSNQITNSRTCAIDFAVDTGEFTKSGNWLFKLSFSGPDEFSVGYGGGFNIEIY